MAVKSALVDAVIRVAGLSGIFIKTHQHTLTKLGVCNKISIPGMSDCNGGVLPGRSVCNSQPEKHITEKQKFDCYWKPRPAGEVELIRKASTFNMKGDRYAQI